MTTNDSARTTTSHTQIWKMKRQQRKSKKTHKLYCDTDPLSDLCLVSLWKDVDVRLKGTGVDDSFVSEGTQTETEYRWGRGDAAQSSQKEIKGLLFITQLADNVDCAFI